MFSRLRDIHYKFAPDTIKRLFKAIPHVGESYIANSITSVFNDYLPNNVPSNCKIEKAYQYIANAEKYNISLICIPQNDFNIFEKKSTSEITVGSSNNCSQYEQKWFNVYAVSYVRDPTWNLFVQSLNTVQCRYDAVNVLTNIHKRHHTARLVGRDMGSPLCVQHLIDILH